MALLTPILASVILYFGRPVLVPLFFSVIFAMLMGPVCRALDKKGWQRGWSCTACVFILMIAMALLILIVVLQISEFVGSLDKIQTKADDYYHQLQDWISGTFNIKPEKQSTVLKSQLESIKKSASGLAGRTVAGIGGFLGNIFIILVLTFLLLYHKEKYAKFFLKLFNQTKRETVEATLDEISHVSQRYLTGRLMSMTFLFIFNSAALLIIGIQNAILLGAIAALLTIVPYVGPIVGSLIPCLTAIITEDSFSPALWVLIALTFVQSIDNYFVEPNVVGGEVRLTALSTILSIFAGGFLWGIAGMVLFIPLLSIVKIICDRVEALKPFGYLIGDDDKSPSSKLKDWVARLFRR